MGADDSSGIAGSETVPVRHKTLSPAFRLAVLTGALESVRLHLRATNEVDAADERGRSPLILAASKGHLDICRLLLEAGANPTWKDCEGNNALSVALFRGHTEIAALLHVITQKADLGVCRNVDGETDKNASHIDLEKRDVTLDANEEGSCGPVEVVGRLIDGDERVLENNGLSSRLDDDGVFDLSCWQEDNKSPPPADDSTCADEADVLQASLSRHVPIDMDQNWDDVEIDLPMLEGLVRRGVRLTDAVKERLRSLIMEALRDGRLQAERIGDALSEEEGLSEADRTEIEAGLRLVLGDLGAVVDDDYLEADSGIEADEDDEEHFGETASDAVNFILRRSSNDIDPFARYAKELPTGRLTREEETALAVAVEEAMIEVLAAIAGSPAAVAKLLSDCGAVLRGEIHAFMMLDIPAGLASEEESFPKDEEEEHEGEDAEAIQLSDELRGRLTAIIDLCQCIAPDQVELAAHLSLAELSPDYLETLQRIASEDVNAGNAGKRIKAGREKAEKAKKCLAESNLKLVIWVAKRHGGLSLLDRIQEGNIGLLRAVDRFNPRRGAKFSTYAVWWIRQSVTRAVADMNRTIRFPVHVSEGLRKIEKARLQAQYESGCEPDADRIAVHAKLPPSTVQKLMSVPEEPVSVDSEAGIRDCIDSIADEEKRSPEAVLITSATQALVRAHLACLEPREERIIRQRFGIGCDQYTLEEIGQMQGVTRERIRQIEAMALKKLGHPSRVKRLRNELR